MERGSWILVLAGLLFAAAVCSGSSQTSHVSSEVLAATDLRQHDIIIWSVVANARGGTVEEELPHECITLLNNIGKPVDLRGLTISDGEGSWTVPPAMRDATIKPGQTWTVCGCTYNETANCPSDVDCRHSICLSNRGECLELKSSGLLIDQWCYPSTTFQGEVLRRPWGTPVSITFWGAAREVQGSCYKVAVGDSTLLVDCGSFMNSDGPLGNSSEHNDTEFFFNPSAVEAVLITHAHDDHIGRLHYLVSQGFRGPIYMTKVTSDLYSTKLELGAPHWNLPNVSHVQLQSEIERAIEVASYMEPVRISDYVFATFINTGHIPGSASIALNLASTAGNTTILFSGDIGTGSHPFLDPPDYNAIAQIGATVLVIESTYGSVVRDPNESGYSAFWTALSDAVKETELIVIPTFSLDRTQHVLAAIGEGMKKGQLPHDLSVVVGGESSCYFTQQYIMFQTNQRAYYDSFSVEFYEESYLWPPFWTYTRGDACTGLELDAVEIKPNYDIIVTPSGFGNSSLSKDLLRQYIEDPLVTFIKVGWAPSYSPMGQLANSADKPRGQITIDGVLYDVKANLINISGTFSGHTDQEGLIRFASSLPDLRTIIITHGEPESAFALKERLEKSLPRVEVLIPGFGDRIPLFCNPQ